MPQQINFCNGCGAKVIKNRLTMRNLFEDFAYRYLNYDNQFLRTFLNLFTKPEKVIGSYINGTRKKYVNVISYFTIALTIFGLQLFIMNLFFKDALDMSSFNKQMSLNMKDPEDFVKTQAEIQSVISNYQSLIYVITTPITAFITWLVFYITNKRTYNYTEHIVVNLYYSAQVIIITALSTLLLMVCGLNFFTISFIFSFLSFVYLGYIFKRMYGLTLGDTIVKTLLFIVLYGLMAITLVIIGVVFALVLTKGFGIKF
ncbi:DUF3667 domain-containing protein [Lacinutrix algicola]|uniref:DUF3667 domain-containing protein n=1 Tax=Lacinutrix algicola TaxID=342954 RepID=UPI0006E13FB9|nr:DUF3667 domain-containing protein [Lacinutrix algicola]